MTQADSRPWRGLRIGALALGAAVVLAHAVRSVLPGAGQDATVDVVLLLAAVLIAAAAATVRTARSGGRAEDVVLSAGLVAYALGWVYWAVVLRPLETPPYPSPADALWALLYAGVLLSLALRVSRGRRLQRDFLLDVLIGTAGAVSAVLGFLVPALAGSARAWSVIGINGVYLAGDTAMLLLTVSVLLVHRSRSAWHLWVLAGSVLLLGLTDALFLAEVAVTGVIPAGSPLNLGWMVAVLLIATTAGHRAVRTEQAVRSRGSVLLVPLVGTVVALGVLLLVPQDAPAARWIAAAAILLAVARMGLAFVEVDALAGSRELALTDELTGLSNRRAFYSLAREQLATGAPATLVLLDLDGFKEVNDTLGHGAGDLLLTLVARRLAAESRARTGVREADVVARLGGDEFAVLFPGVEPHLGREAAARVADALASTYDVEGIRVRVSAAAGIVHAPEHGHAVDELLRRADVAMYAAKSGRARSVEYRAELDTRSRDGLRRVERMRAALVEGRLVLHYQPKVDLLTGRVTGVEALARFMDPVHGLLMPGEFLAPLAQAGELAALTEQVLDKACAQARRWADLGRPLPVAVNVPADGFGDGELTDLVRSTLERHGLHGPSLTVEVTEQVLLRDHAEGRAALDAIRALGVRVSVDDYGTGYSSLSYLRDLPLDEIKLDRSFVEAMVGDERATRIVESTVTLAHGLGLTVVAEGVETEGARQAVIAAGCDEVQGYLLARPMSAEALDELLARWVTDAA